MAKKPIVYQHSPGLAASTARKPIASPPIPDPGRRPAPGSAEVPYEPGMGADRPGGTGEPAPPPAAGGDNGNGGSDTPPPPPDIDWAQVYFGNYGLPSDLIGQIEDLGKKYGTTNPDVFFHAAQNLVRGSDWFAQTYPGFAAGVRAGLFSDENGYRGYVSALTNVYQQYLGRHVSGNETAAALAQGATPSLIANQFQGDTIANVNQNQWQYLTGAFDESGPLSAAETQAFGREQAGIDTPLGEMVQKRVTQAMGRAQALFGGTLGAPSLSLSSSGRLLSPSLGGNASPDVAA